jgi:thioester reductase-like protein
MALSSLSFPVSAELQSVASKDFVAALAQILQRVLKVEQLAVKVDECCRLITLNVESERHDIELQLNEVFTDQTCFSQLTIEPQSAEHRGATVQLVLTLGDEQINVTFDDSIYKEALLSTILESALIQLMDAHTRASAILDKQRQHFSGSEAVCSADINQQFLHVVEQYPTRQAITDGDICLTYHELAQQVSVLASRLASLSAQGKRVAVVLPRGHKTVISMLAISFVGATYVPIETLNPVSYICEQINHVAAAVVICDKTDHNYHDLPNSHHWDSLIVSADTEFVPEVMHPDREFTVLFTSGSTGKSKAVVHAERSFLARFNWQWQVSPITAEDVVGQRTNVGFGPHIWEILGAILKGAHLVIMTDAIVANPRQLISYIQQYEITRLALVPSIAKLLVETKGVQANCRSLQVCSLAGEEFDMQLVEKLRNTFVGCQIFNDFGSTECNCMFFHPISNEVTLGRPSSAASLTIINDAGEPCLPFEAGMLHVNGKTLAKGYVNEEGEITELEQSHYGYVTGDNVFFDEKGYLYSQGRKNNVVKVRGMRVDIVNVEQQLQTLLEIDKLKLVARKKSDGETQLIAFYQSSHLAVELLRGCKDKLPVHYCPAFFFPVSSFPRLPNGKLDRMQLLKKLETHTDLNQSTAKNKLVKILADITELPLSSLDIEDYALVELGVDSLGLVKVVHAIESVFSRSVSLAQVAAITRFSELVKLAQGRFDTPTQKLVHQDIDHLLTYFTTLQPQSNPTGNSVLLTGASGFIGAFMLAELTKYHIVYCPVRAQNAQHAQAKVQQNLQKYGLSVEVPENLCVVAGDITKPNFALSKVHFEQLITEVGTVYHLAANVNHVQSYANLRVEVLQTWKNLLPFINCAGSQFHFFSSIAACKLIDGHWREEAVPENPDSIASGYGQSKWLGEQLLKSCQAAAFINIYRLGEIGGCRTTGQGRSDDFVHNLLAVMSAIPFYPAELAKSTLLVDMLPVDWLVQFTQLKMTQQKVTLFNLQNPNPTPLSRVLDDLGCKPSTEVSWQQWLTEIHQCVVDNADSLLNVLPFYTTPNDPSWLNYFSSLEMDCNAMTQISGERLGTPEIAQLQWRAYAQNWRKHGLDFNKNKGAQF